MSENPYRDAAQGYLAAGFNPLPLPYRQKASPPSGFTGRDGREPTKAQVTEWAQRGPQNVALRLPANVIGIDVDNYAKGGRQRTGGQTIARAQIELGLLPDTWRSTSRPGDPVSGIYLFRVEPLPEGHNWPEAIGTNVEIIQHSHRYLVAAPSIHPDTERPYEWFGPDGTRTDEPPTVDDLPELPEGWRTWLLQDHMEVMGAAPPLADATPFIELSEDRQVRARDAVRRRSDSWRATFAEAADWSDGERDRKGRGWEALVRDAAYVFAGLATAPWCELDEDAAHALYEEVVPAEVRAAVPEKWTSNLLAKFASGLKPIPVAPWQEAIRESPEVDFTSVGPTDYPDIPPSISDAHLAPWVAYKGLRGDWCYSSGLGWLHWDGRRWNPKDDQDVREAVRAAFVQVVSDVTKSGANAATLRQYARLLDAGKIGAVLGLVKGVVSVAADQFDQQADLLNVANGVVDLRTGTLLPHDRKHYLTKITKARYIPGSTHPDWETALTCLDGPVMEWLQIRFGQAVTGYPTSDDILPIGQGGGANGKSTLLAGLVAALGDHLVMVPEKLLRVSNGDHPTEMMTLFGTRLAIIDETPEAGQLNVPRLKATLGAPLMTARLIRKDNVSWHPTHSLFVMTNHLPRVGETDHGTWRRLALVRFDKKYAVSNLRARIERGHGGRREAVLAWVVAGAKAWYANDRTIPEAPDRVKRDTEAWRSQADYILAYINDRIVFDPLACVRSQDLLHDFNDWQTDRGARPWSDQTFASRFGEHSLVLAHPDVVKVQQRKPKGLQPIPGTQLSAEQWARAHVWLGVRWRGNQDDDTDNPPLKKKAN
ncbi:phage/plasmid primase, P4 family [Nostocoides veronense]|uniref:SF3 helicase domain-containing protein n=1 Tax=Nostocoides veronense TaxID=330836 RepID=A0ABN2LY12_9MICO